jgi:membrane-bound ClpP family serine protease
MGLIAVGVWYLLLLFVPRGDLFFGLLGTLFLLISFVPLAQFDVSTANKLWLAAMHLTVYIFVVPILSGSVNRVATRRFR